MTSTLLSLALLSGAHALPVYDDAVLLAPGDPDLGDQEAGQCIPMNRQDGVWDSVVSGVIDRMHVYLADDAASVYTARDPAKVDQGATQDQIRATLLEAIEVWNRESRGPVLRYEGETRASLLDPNDLSAPWTCSSTRTSSLDPGITMKMPAVIVSPIESQGGSYDKLGGVYVLGDSGGSCADGGVPILGLNIQQPGSLRSMKYVLVHELGHTLGLGHPFGDALEALDDVCDTAPGGASCATCTATNRVQDCYPGQALEGAASVMHYNLEDFSNATGRTSDEGRRMWRQHLWPYDADCVDDDFGAAAGSQIDGRERLLNVSWRTYDGSFNRWSPTAGAGFDTAKGSTTAGALHVPLDGGTWYPFVQDYDGGAGRVWGATSSIDNGTLGPWVDLTESDEVQEADVGWFTHISPLALSVREKLGGSHDWVLLVPDGIPSSVGHHQVSAVDPPRLAQVRGPSVGTRAHEHPLRSCTGTGSCQSSMLKSHISARSAFDPVTETTLFATVRTRDCATGDPCFAPRIHVGYGGGGSYNFTLARPDVPTGFDLGLPSAPDAGDAYSGTTHVAPALACADAARGAPGRCMLAWVDDGVHDNHVLVTWFDVASGQVQWSGITRELRPDNHVVDGDDPVGFGSPVSSASDLSAVYADGRFFVALKSAEEDQAGRVAFAQTYYRNLDSWDSVTVLPDARTVEAPFVMIDPTTDRPEMALVWSHLPSGL